MKYQLLSNPWTESGDVIEHILFNRGIKNVDEYLYTTDSVINSYLLLGKDVLEDAWMELSTTILTNRKCLIVVDADCDGYTSSALLMNYLHEFYPEWVENNVKYYLHQGKQHGINDCIEYIKEFAFDLVICPDAGSNEGNLHYELKELGINVICLDHHIVDNYNTCAFVINNQLSQYPNKELSGVGITWQFCKYIDNYFGVNKADDFLDLVALGNSGDMMSLISLETKHLINKGFEPKNVRNPFIKMMWAKNKYMLGDRITPHGSSFYIVPFVNAIVRSGTQEEKELIFNSMLEWKSEIKVVTDKKGHRGELITIVEQAGLIVTRVKNRQTVAETKGIEFIEKIMKDKDMLNKHKVLLFLLEPGEIDRNIAGLIANKVMAKYQRPVAILTKVVDNDIVSYQGSARGYTKSGVLSFKEICEQTNSIMYASGHDNAFGLGISEENIEGFIDSTDELLINITSEAIYYVDYIFNNSTIDGNIVSTVAELKPLWGQDVDEAYVAIENFAITKDMVNVYRKTSNTLKIVCKNSNVEIIMFGAPEDLCNRLENAIGIIYINIIGTCSNSEYYGRITPQIKIKDYEIISETKWVI